MNMYERIKASVPPKDACKSQGGERYTWYTYF